MINKFLRRFKYHPNKLSTGLHEEYMDLREKMLWANFKALEDFIEVEKAHMHVIFENTIYPGCRSKAYILGIVNPFFRCPQAGLDHLDWEIGLEDMPGQSICAKEQKDLYQWWQWRKGHDVWEIWSEIEDLVDVDILEEEWKQDEEDDMMLTRLVAIRRSLWT